MSGSRNEESPFRALTPSIRTAVLNLFSRNEESPFRALTPFNFQMFVEVHLIVEMKRARLGR